MKSILLSLVLLLTVNLAQAQDWAPFKTGQKYLYGISTKLPPFGQIGLRGRLIIPVHLDTLSQSPTAGYVFGPKDTLYKDQTGMWIGGGLFSNSLTRSAPGEYKISNVTFLSQITEGAPVALIKAGTNVVLTGYVLNKRAGLVLGQPDSITNIRWVAATGFGTHRLANDSSFILSKQYGLIQFQNFGVWDDFSTDPYSFFYGVWNTYQFSENVRLEGIPGLQMGTAELDSPKKPCPGDMEQVLTEKNFDFMAHGGPCIRQTGHSFDVYQEICTDTITDSQGDFYGTWRATRGFCDSSFTGPVQATDSATFSRGAYYIQEGVDMLRNKIGYYPTQSAFGRIFSGQFKAETGIGFRFWISKGIDIPDRLQILTNPLADVAGSSEAGWWQWSNSPCSTGTFQPFSIQVQVPSYLRIGTHTEGELLLISSAKDVKHQSSLHITPNPTSSDLWIASPEKVKQLYVVNILGKVVMQTAPDPQGKINIADLPSGMYQLRWYGHEGEGGTERVVKQ